MAEAPTHDAMACGVKVVGVVVVFHPDSAVLGALLQSLARQVASIVVVDNTPGGAAGLPQDALVVGYNAGVAHGLNLGIAQAWRRGASHVLLCDQDSLPAPGMVDALLAAHRELQRRGLPVAAVGPMYADLHSGRTRAFKVRRRWLPRYVQLRASDPAVEVLTLITAGTLIGRGAFDAIGPMREDLFVDRVDTEWCLRAGRFGALVYAVPGARLLQRMGEGALTLPGGIGVSVYGPERLYYQVRNLVALSRDGTLPLGMSIAASVNALLSIVVRLAFRRDRRAVMPLALRGVRDGFRNRLGPLYKGGPAPTPPPARD